MSEDSGTPGGRGAAGKGTVGFILAIALIDVIGIAIMLFFVFGFTMGLPMPVQTPGR